MNPMTKVSLEKRQLLRAPTRRLARTGEQGFIDVNQGVWHLYGNT